MVRSFVKGGALCTALLSSIVSARALAQDAPADSETAPDAAPAAAGAPDSDETGMKFTARNRETANAPAPVRTPGRARTMEELSEAGTSELSIRSIRWRYSLNFFGDVSVSYGTPSAPENNLAFVLGDQDVLLKGELENHIIASTEFSLEHHEGGVGVDIERYNVRWQPSSSFFIEAGRSHTFLGYWNNAYHHGRWLQLTITRPRWVAFEDDDGVLPVHWVGLNVGGKVALGGITHLDLVASVGNGRGAIVDDVRTVEDFQSMKAFHGSAELVGIASSDLRMGVSGVIDRIPPQNAMVRPNLPNTPIDELILGGYVAYPSLPLLVIVEAYTIIHRANVDTSMGTVDHRWAVYGGFGLLGYAFGRVTPYIEIERFASQGGLDPFLNPGSMDVTPGSFDTVAGVFGTRVDLSNWSALKFEYRATRDTITAETSQMGLINWSWGF